MIERLIGRPWLRRSYRVPNLQFDDLVAEGESFGGKLDSDSGLAVPTEGGVDELHDD